MSDITITYPDGAKKQYQKGITGLEIAKSIGPRLAKDALAIKVNGVLYDLDHRIESDAQISIITFASEEGKEIYRHSTAHLFAYAIQELYPDAKNTIGPAVDEGFYYDFDDLNISEADFPTIEAKMKELSAKGIPFTRSELTLDDVKKRFPKNPYKVEMASEFATKGDKLSAYSIGDRFTDLCRGPHVPNTAYIKAIHLFLVAKAYWRGDAKNKQLTRVYGISFPSQKELDDYKKQREEAEKRDHKRIGMEMGIYMQHPVIGKGQPVWLPNGAAIRRTLEAFAVKMEEDAGYVRVVTPVMAKEELFLQSGHLPHYADSMFPKMVMDDGNYILKAMNCPMHHLVYGNKVYSYKELPVRIAEYGLCFRNELSGALSGLLRVRAMAMNDAHIYCRKDQIADEINGVLDLIKNYYKVFGFKDYYFRLSRWDPNNKDKYIDEPKNWDYCEQVLREILQKCGVPFVEATNEAAFYGPKIDVQFKTVTGREETMSTVQLDFAAKKRFGLEYVDKDGQKNNEVFVIHRAPLSTHERMIAMLIEHFAGKFPLWLSPRQVRVLSISEKTEGYAKKVVDELKALDIHAELDARAETINKKIREAQLEQWNYICVVGEKEAQNGTVNVRTRDNVVHGEWSMQKLKDALTEEISSKRF